MTALRQRYVLATLCFQSSSMPTPGAIVGLDNTADKTWTNPLLHECGWRHVGSDDDGVTVTSLILVRQLVGGRIPTDLVLLTGLATLDLQCNDISGMIPSFLGSLAVLMDMNLADNRFVYWPCGATS
jgi:hypothetical protein